MADPGLNMTIKVTVVAVMLLTGAISPVRAQITTHTALPVGKGQAIVRIQSKLIRSTRDPGPANRDLRVLAFPVVGAYGITSKWTLFAVLPVIDKSLEVTMPTGRVSRDAFGVADMQLFARHTVYQRNKRGQTLRLAPFVGIELPTGSNSRTDDAGPIPRPLQPGSGSWDPFAGLVLTRQTFAWQVDASISYKRNTEADDFRFGDEARFDVATKARLLPRTLGGGIPDFLYANLETNVIWSDNNEMRGGTTWYVAPGFQYVTKRTILEGAVQLPLLQDLNGLALKNNFIATVGIRVIL